MSNSSKDPYALLGVPKTATQADIKKAYRKLAKQFHPDVNKGDKIVEQKFKEITNAYNLLSEPDKRAKYDRGEVDESGVERTHGFKYRQGPTGGFGDMGGGAGDAGDIFADFFRKAGFGGRSSAYGARNQSSSRKAPVRGPDVSYSVRVDFLTAALGGKRNIQMADGNSVSVSIPPGTEDLQKLRLKGKGYQSPFGGESGDAIIEIHVDPHPKFKKFGNDILLNLPITIVEAVLGGKVEVPTIHGSVKITIPENSSTGTKLRLKGKGIHLKAGTQGDQMITLKIVLPKQPNKDLKSLIEKWSRNNDYSVR